MKKDIEILAPCGSFDSLRAAVNAGADAVYLGGNLFGARAYANNFDNEELIEAIRYAHLYDVKVYLTVNTLFKNEDIEKLYDFIAPLYDKGLDAVIVQDLGVLSFIHRCFPHIDIHASTQMSATGPYGSRFLKELGASRIVTAREISLSEIRKIHENVDIEIESFVHGAMCYSYSGQCFLSSFIGGRSGNRGRCAGSCRLPYNVKGKTSYILSLKDMATLSILPDIIESGVYSLKIEGRMKNPEYTAFVTSMYRKYADMYFKDGRSKYKVSEDDYRDLMDIFNRGNYTTGYYTMHNSPEMLSSKRPNHQGVLVGEVTKHERSSVTLKLLNDVNKGDVLDVCDNYEYTLGENAKKDTKILLNVSKDNKLKVGDKIFRTRNNELIGRIDDMIKSDKKIHLMGTFFAAPGQLATLTLSKDNISATVWSDTVTENAMNRPTTEEDIKEKLERLGGTSYLLDNLDINISENLFIPVKTLNEMRRQCILKLEDNIAAGYERKREKVCYNVNGQSDSVITSTYYTVQVESESALYKAIRYDAVKIIYIESYAICDFNALIEACHKNGKKLYVALPYICRKSSYNVMDEFMEADGFLVRNLEEYGYIRENNIKISLIFDFNVYTYNNIACETLSPYGDVTCGIELDYKELSENDLSQSELIIYGYLPMMISASCINKNTCKCDKVSKVIVMKDRLGNEYKVKNICKDCYNVIYNYVPLAIYDKKDEIEKLSPRSLRIIINGFEDGRCDDIIKNVISGKLDITQYTRGHFLKKVL